MWRCSAAPTGFVTSKACSTRRWTRLRRGGWLVMEFGYGQERRRAAARRGAPGAASRARPRRLRAFPAPAVIERTMTDCLFCKIIGGQIPGQFVHQDDQLVAIKDINPQAPLHVLIIPRRHIATLNDLTLATTASLGSMHRAAAADRQGTRLRRARLPDGVQLQSRSRPDGVPHPSASAGGPRPSLASGVR